MRALLIGMAVLSAACETVPEIVYIDDAGVMDSPDADVVDASADGATTCPNGIPTNATMCCKAIPCSGANCSAACADCELKCVVGQICCPNPANHAMCKTAASCN